MEDRVDQGSVTFEWCGESCQITISLSKSTIVGVLEKAVLTDVLSNVVESIRYTLAGRVAEES